MPHDVDDAKARDVVARVAESGSRRQAVNACFDLAEGERVQRVKHRSKSFVSVYTCPENVAYSLCSAPICSAPKEYLDNSLQMLATGTKIETITHSADVSLELSTRNICV
jgi:hypothetical protein